jgi:hypothetical protein
MKLTKLKDKSSLYEPLSDINMRTTSVEFNSFISQVEKTYLDLSFQRDGGWDQNQKNSFLELTKSTGQIFTPIYICDNDECYKNAVDTETKDYFYDLLKNKNKKYLSIDGNNRSSTISENKSKIMDDNWNIVNNDIVVCKITKIKKSGIPLLFNYLNSGLKQTNQVMRNTLSYDLGSIVYNLSKNYNSIPLFTKPNGKNDQELVSRCLMISDHYLRNKDILPIDEISAIGLHRNNLDNFFLKNHNGLVLHPKTIELTKSIFSKVDDVVSTNISGIKRGGQVYFLNIFMLILFEYRNINIDNKKFFNRYIKIEHVLRAQSDKKYDNSSRDHSVGNVKYRYNILKQIIKKYEWEFVIPILQVV